jgi:leader peptidase (prepilin peptidase)/N-methyltransferase
MNTFILEWFFYTLTVLSIGSYSAAFISRWPMKHAYLWEKEAHDFLSLPFNNLPPVQISNTRSHCSHCRQILKWQDLIPLLSYLLLKGKCRYCQKKISSHYPTIELLHLVFCLPLLWLYEDVYQLTLQTVLVSALITAACIDVVHELIPDECSTIILACGLLLHLLSNTLENSVLGMLIGYSLIFILRWLYLTFRKQEGIGLGDVKLIAAIGAWLGFSSLAPLLLCASLTGILYTLLFNKDGSKHIAFGPFLILSGMLMFYL